MNTLFHLAINVTDLSLARQFYGDTLECKEGRSTETWVDFDFFGHQLSLHLGEVLSTQPTGRVGQHNVPMPHFGIILPLSTFHTLAARLQAANTPFDIPPCQRFTGEAGEQYTMFFRDPFGNPIEVKSFTHADEVYQS